MHLAMGMSKKVLAPSGAAVAPLLLTKFEDAGGTGFRAPPSIAAHFLSPDKAARISPSGHHGFRKRGD